MKLAPRGPFQLQVGSKQWPAMEAPERGWEWPAERIEAEGQKCPFTDSTMHMSEMLGRCTGLKVHCTVDCSDFDFFDYKEHNKPDLDAK
jgi:hypothetical protein